MKDDAVMAVVGILVIVFGLKMTTVTGAMPGARGGYPPPLRFRVLLVSFGLFMSVLGAVRLLQRLSEMPQGAFPH